MALAKLLILLGIVLTCSLPSGCQRLHISPRDNQVRDVHSKVILSCSFEDYDPVKYADEEDFELKWIGPNTQHINSDHGRIHTERITNRTIKLYIHRFEDIDAGLYSCQLDDHGQLYKETVHLGLFEDIRFSNKSFNYEVRVKSRSVLLECSAFGIPIPTISWRFNKTKLPDVSEKYRSEKEGLRIYDVTLDDNGTYECRAQVESQGSLKMRYIQLDVLYPPVMVEPPQVLDQVVKGLDAILHCEADGNPTVKYEWYLERRVSEFVKAKVPIQRRGQKLRIKDFGSENEGRYFCRVSNSVGTKESHVDVTMLVPPIIKEFGSQVTVEGRTLILPCEPIEGRPSPDLFWSNANGNQLFVEGNQLVDDGTISIDNTHRGISKLIIKNIQRDHAGDYMCRAINAVGNSSKIAKISVDYSPKISSSFTDVFGWPGQLRNLSCTADGRPYPVIAWFSRGQHIFDTRSYKIETVGTQVVTSTLQIRIGIGQSWLFGNYSCVAKNQHGLASVAFHLRESEVPDLPHNVSVLKVDATKAVLLAASPRKTGGIPLTSWRVKYEEIDGDLRGETVFESVPGESVMTLTVTQLQPNTEYKFHLAAENEVGYGKAIVFLVRTIQKSVLDEQSDVPHKSPAVENTWKDPAALGKETVEGTDPDGSNPSIGVVLGFICILAILTLLSVGGLFWYRRRRGISADGKWLGVFMKNSSGKDRKQQNRRTDDNDPDDVIQMGEVKQPCDGFLLPPAGSEGQPTGLDPSLMKATNSFESGFGLSPKPRRLFSPATQVRSLTVTPMSVRRFAGDQTWSQTQHESTDDLSSGFGTAEPESIQSDLVLGPEDEAGTRGMFAQHDPDLDSIPDIDDDE